MSSSPFTPISPYCGRLRSKKYYMVGHPPLCEEDLLDGSRHCWCQRTKQAVGPDADLVAPEACQSERTCYEPIGAPLAARATPGKSRNGDTA